MTTIYRRWHELSSAPSAEPVSTATVKSHLRVDTSDDDTLIGSLITEVRKEVEDHLGKALITQTRILHMDGFAEDYVELPFSPLQSVSSIATINDAGTESTFSSDNYDVITGDDKAGLIQLKDGQAWPTDIRPAGGVKITYVCGYGDAGTDVPHQIILALKDWIAARYAYRGDEPLPAAALDPAKAALDRKRVIRI